MDKTLFCGAVTLCLLGCLQSPDKVALPDLPDVAEAPDPGRADDDPQVARPELAVSPGGLPILPVGDAHALRRFEFAAAGAATFVAAASLSGGRIIAAGAVQPDGDDTQQQGWLVRIGTDGAAEGEYQSPDSAAAGAVTVLSDGRIVAGASHNDQVRLTALSDDMDGLTFLSHVDFEGAETVEVFGLASLPDGGLVVTGAWVAPFEPGVQKREWFVSRLDKDLGIVWTRFFEGSMGLDIQPDPDGGFVAVGYRTFDNTSRDAAWMLRIGPDGEQLAGREVYDQSAHERAVVALPSPVGYLVLGYTESMGAGGRDGLAVRASNQGTPIGAAVAVGTPYWEVFDAGVTVGAQTLVVGQHRYEGGPIQGYVAVLDSFLKPAAQYVIQVDHGNQLHAVLVRPDGSLALIGTMHKDGPSVGQLLMTGTDGALVGP